MIELTEKEKQSLGKYGTMRMRYLKEYQPLVWNEMALSGQLYPHLREVEDTANQRLERMMEQMAKEAGATEELKARDQMKWVGLMNSLKAQVEEMIYSELIYD